MINCAVGIDGDGIPEIVLASEFAMEAKKSTGMVRCCSTTATRGSRGT